MSPGIAILLAGIILLVMIRLSKKRLRSIILRTCEKD